MRLIKFLALSFVLFNNFLFSQGLAKNNSNDIIVEMYFEPFDTQGWQNYLNFDLIRKKVKNIKLKVYPLVNKDENNKFLNQRGEIETTEVARIEAIIEKYPAKLNDYLIARSLNMYPDGWKESLIYSQINPVDFDSYIQNNKNSLVEKAYKRIKDKKIDGLSIFINSSLYKGSNKITDVIENINSYLATSDKLNLYKDDLAKMRGPKFKIIYDSSTKDWVDDNIVEAFKRFFSSLEIEKIDISDLGNEKDKIKMLPAYMIEKTSQVQEVLSQAIDQNVFDITDNYYVYYNQNSKLVLLNRKKEDNKLELFVMAQCPFGVMAENTIINAIESAKLSKDIKVEIHYIGDAFKDANGVAQFHSLHGDDEWKEDARQLLIKKIYPDKYFSYLKERNKSYNSAEWKESAKKAGIDPNLIENKLDDAKKLLGDDFEYSNSLKINVSPTFLVNGNILVVGLNNLKTFEQYKNVDIVNSSAQGGCK